MTFSVIGPTYPFRGGIAHYTSLLVRALRTRHDVQFFSFSRQYPRWLYPGNGDRDPSAALLTHEAPTGTFDALNPWEWRSIASRVAAARSSLVILSWSTVYWSPFYWIFLRALKGSNGPRTVFICHNVFEHEARGAKTSISKRVLTKGDLFVTHSDWDKRNLLSWMSPSRANCVRVCPHPIYEHLKQPSLSKAVARSLVGVQAERVLLFFGFIREYKGLRYLLESLPLLEKSLGIHLLIAGEVWGDARPYYELINNLGLASCVTFVQKYIPNEEVARYFAAADILVSPCITASQSGIVQLAYGFSKPVIVGRVGGLPEAVDEGRTGYLVPPKDAAAIARAVMDFYENSREGDMVTAIRQKHSAISWERLRETIESFVEENRQNDRL
jgi:glycosyltransferase involved in cell wall biosynthesis